MIAIKRTYRAGEIDLPEGLSRNVRTYNSIIWFHFTLKVSYKAKIQLGQW